MINETIVFGGDSFDCKGTEESGMIKQQSTGKTYQYQINAEEMKKAEKNTHDCLVEMCQAIRKGYADASEVENQPPGNKTDRADDQPA